MPTNEWYTPPHVLEAVREVFEGPIELDPASCTRANETVQATKIYTKEDNGLMHPWTIDEKPARTFLNPPYGRTSSSGSNLEHFTRHIIEQYECGNVKQAVMIIPVNTATSWFEPLWKYSICFPVSRIRFLQEDGSPSDGMSFGTCLVYFGLKTGLFAKVFLQYGPVITPNGIYHRGEKPRQKTLVLSQ